VLPLFVFIPTVLGTMFQQQGPDPGSAAQARRRGWPMPPLKK
jgi:hypothetical protein